MRKPLTDDELAAMDDICDRLYDALLKHHEDVQQARRDPGRLADVLAEGQATLSRAYADVTLLVARRK